MQWRSRVGVELSAAGRSATPTERAKVIAAGAGLAPLVRSRRLRRPREEGTSAPSSSRGPPLWQGLRLDPAMLWVAVYTFMKPANSWPRACFPLQVADGGAEAIGASEPSIDRTCVAALGRGANMRAAGQRPWTSRHAVVWLLASAVAALGTADAFAAPPHKHVPAHYSKTAKAERHKHASASDPKSSAAARKSVRNRTARAVVPSIPLPVARPAAASLPPDLAATKQAIELVREGKPTEATLIATSIGDPVAQKLVEWSLLRGPESEVRLERYAAFIRAHPNWPSIPLLRRRAEAKLWQDRHDAATVRRFLGEKRPTSSLGRLAFARMLKAEGDEAGAAREVRAVWRSAELSAALGAAVLDEFRDELIHTDHAARMDWRISAKDFGAAMREAKRLGVDEMAIVKACAAAETTLPRLGRCSTRFRARHVVISASHCAAFTGWCDATNSRPRLRRCLRLRPRICDIRTPMNGGASGGYWPAGSSTSATRRPHIGWCVRQRFQPIPITVPNSTSWLGGSRCGFSTIRPSP